MKAQAGGRRYTAWFRPDGSGAGKPIESDLNPPFRQLVIERGIRSLMRVTIRLRGSVVGVGMRF